MSITVKELKEKLSTLNDDDILALEETYYVDDYKKYNPGANVVFINRDLAMVSNPTKSSHSKS